MPQVISAPQSWYRGCNLESPEQDSYNPNSTAYCPDAFSANASWSLPEPVLLMPSIAPNSGAITSVASAALNGGPDGTTAVAASPGAAAPGQSLGPASMTNAVPQILPPTWNSGPAKAPSVAEQLSDWACANPALAAVSVAGVFFLFASGSKRRR